jgi:hypothetical protein
MVPDEAVQLSRARLRATDSLLKREGCASDSGSIREIVSINTERLTVGGRSARSPSLTGRRIERRLAEQTRLR